MIRRFLSFLVISLSVTGACAQSLEEVVITTLRTNPDIIVGKHNLAAARQLRKQARGAYFPVIDLIFAGGEENSNNTTTRAAGVDSLSLTRQESSLRVTQLLYDGFSTRNLVKQQNALASAALTGPFRSARATVPHTRLSFELSRLSPIRK